MHARPADQNFEKLLYEMLATNRPMIDLQHVVEARLVAAVEEDKELTARPEVMDDWCIINYHDSSGNLTRCEFLETERSWKNRDAIQEYNDLIDEGVEVMVIVPDAVLELMEAALGSYAHPDVQLSCMDDMGIEVREVISE